MKKYEVLENHYDLKKGTVVHDQGISQVETDMNKMEHRLVVIENANVPITHIVPLNKLLELEQ